MFLKISIIFAIFAVAGNNAAKYPPELPKCRYGDTECIKNAITVIIGKNPKGHPGLALPSLEPFYLTSVNIDQRGNRAVSINLNLRNIELSGINGASITRVVGFQKDIKTSKYEIYAKVPKLILDADYTINGNVLVLPISGTGRAHLELSNMEIEFKYHPKIIVKKGQEHIQTDKFQMDFTTTKLQLHFTNLFNGNKALGDNMNIFLNENWQDILNELKPAIRETIEGVIVNIINRIFAKIPYDELFIE